MTDTYNQLKDELSVLYPGVTDDELNEMTNNLVDFYTIATKVILEDESRKAETSLSDIDDS